MRSPLGRKLYQLSRHCKTMTHLRQVLAQIVHADVSDHSSSLSALVAFSATSPQGCVHFASLLFSRIVEPGSFAYNSMMQGLVNAGFPDRALTLYGRMVRDEGTRPDKFTFPFAVKACALLAAVGTGMAIHARILRLGFSLDPYVCSGMVKMYCEFGEIGHARCLFDEMPDRDCVIWNSMIGGYVKCGFLETAYVLFEEMPFKNVGTYNAMIGGYVKLGCMERACELFEKIPERDVVSWNTMIGAHARLGSVGTAWELFNQVPGRNVTTWSAIISGFAQSSQFNDALEGFKGILVDGMRPNQAILVSVLSSCAHLGAFEQGIWIHHYIDRQGIQVNDVLGASLIDMYSKCGFMQAALLVFENIQRREVCSWTAIIYGLAIHGRSHEAVNLFDEMEGLQIRPNNITFLAILSVCSHAGFVARGREIFDRINRVYIMNPTIEHYTCMVDILSRANQLEEAQQLIESMPMEPDIFVWGALFSGYRIHGHHAFMSEDLCEKLAMLRPRDSGTYVLASNMYASTNQWDDAMRIRRMMVEFGVEKNPGCSLIEVDQFVHEFLAGGTIHPMSKQVYGMLNQIYREIKTEGLL